MYMYNNSDNNNNRDPYFGKQTTNTRIVCITYILHLHNMTILC